MEYETIGEMTTKLRIGRAMVKFSESLDKIYGA